MIRWGGGRFSDCKVESQILVNNQNRFASMLEAAVIQDPHDSYQHMLGVRVYGLRFREITGLRYLAKIPADFQ